MGSDEKSKLKKFAYEWLEGDWQIYMEDDEWKNDWRHTDIKEWRAYNNFIGRKFSEIPELRNDWRFLADFWEKGGTITHDMWKHIIAVYRGKEKAPDHRTPRFTTIVRHIEIAHFVMIEEGRSRNRDEAIGKAVQKFRVNAKTVRRALKEHGRPSLRKRRKLHPRE